VISFTFCRDSKDQGAPGRDTVCLVETFGGIPAARRGLSLLGVTPALHLVSEEDEEAIRVSSTNYPDAQQLGDVTEVSIEILDKAAARAPKSPMYSHLWLTMPGFQRPQRDSCGGLATCCGPLSPARKSERRAKWWHHSSMRIGLSCAA